MAAMPKMEIEVDVQSPAKFESWAIIELFGHQRIAGKVTEQTIGGCAFIRVDVPACDGVAAFTKFFTQGAIYALTPCDEPAAMAAVKYFRAQPINPFVLPVDRQLPAPDYDEDLDDEGLEDVE